MNFTKNMNKEVSFIQTILLVIFFLVSVAFVGYNIHPLITYGVKSTPLNSMFCVVGIAGCAISVLTFLNLMEKNL